MSLPEDLETELEQINSSTPAEEAGNEQSSQERVESKPANELIPRHRYNFQRDQRMAAEQRAAQLEQELQKYQQYLASLQQAQPQGPTIEEQLAEFDRKIEDARADGDKDQVAKLRAEQRRLEQQVVAYQVKQTLPQTSLDPDQVMKRTSDGMKLEKLIDRLEVEYPMLDEDHPNFDPELSEEVMTLYDSLRQKMPMASAMERAVAYVTKAHEINPLQGLLSARKTNVKRNVEAARAQPPDLSGFGYDSSRAGVSRPTDVMKMTQEQFEALGDKEIEKLLDLA